MIEAKVSAEVYAKLERQAKARNMTITEYVSFLVQLARSNGKLRSR